MFKKTVLFLYLALVTTMIVATFVEYSQGTSFVTKHIYHSSFFLIGWVMLVVFTGVTLWKRRMWRQFPSLLLHVSFMVMLAGAFLSFLTSRKGYVHLRMDKPANQFVEQETRRLTDLPFSIRLDTFWVEYYPGTEAPSDYISRVSCYSRQGAKVNQSVISMNQVCDWEGYRFYQSSFDEDGHGSWLSVNYDPWGTALTYTGYVLMALSMVGVLVSRAGEFRRLLNHPLLKRGGLLFLFLTASIQASGKKLSIISRQEADSLAVTQVIYHDRVVPFNTLAIDFVKKLSGTDHFSGLTPEQVLGSWMKYPEEWRFVPIIRIKSAELRRNLGLGDSPYVRLVDVMEEDRYRLRDLWQPKKAKSGKPSSLQKAILEADEKVALVWMLLQGTLVKPLPQDGSVQPLSSAKLQAELFYNRIPFSKILFMANLTLGFLSFGALLYRGLRRRKVMFVETLFGEVGLALSMLFHALGYLLRWYIGGRIPLSNGYETMQFMALCVLMVAFLLRRRFTYVVPFGFLLSGFTLLVSYLGQMNPQITPLMPVLVSPWLSSHVSFIMISYALLAFIGLNGVLALCLPREAERLMLFSRLLLYPAVFFLGIGIFIGAVWANVSWGRYWAWDPKEVWALITLMVYGLTFHAGSLSWFRNLKFFHAYMIAAFLTVLMTYFGVNYLLGGMHSYA